MNGFLSGVIFFLPKIAIFKSFKCKFFALFPVLLLPHLDS